MIDLLILFSCVALWFLIKILEWFDQWKAYRKGERRRLATKDW